MSTTVLPGDVLVVRMPHSFWGKLIRLGAALGDHPNIRNHVIVASHFDAAGTLWGVEARPGGVGFCNLAPWLADRWTINNADQPKTQAQRDSVVLVVDAMVPRKVQYDWPAIVQDAFDEVGVDDLYRLKDYDTKLTPDHVVCSSLTSWAYLHVGLNAPLADRAPAIRGVEPHHWDQWIETRGWEK